IAIPIGQARDIPTRNSVRQVLSVDSFSGASGGAQLFSSLREFSVIREQESGSQILFPQTPGCFNKTEGREIKEREQSEFSKGMHLGVKSAHQIRACLQFREGAFGILC